MRNIQIPQDILEKTTRCKKKFSCLYSDSTELCKVGKINGPDHLFIISQKNQSCPYKTLKKQFKMSYFVCTCPTRIELYINHGIWLCYKEKHILSSEQGYIDTTTRFECDSIFLHDDSLTICPIENSVTIFFPLEILFYPVFSYIQTCSKQKIIRVILYSQNNFKRE